MSKCWKLEKKNKIMGNLLKFQNKLQEKIWKSKRI